MRLDKLSKSTIRKFLKKTEKGKQYLENRLINKTDVIFTSFPKTGRTWFRVLLMRYFQLYYKIQLDPSNFNFLTLHPDAPKIIFTHDFINPTWCTVDELSKSKKRFYGKKIVLLFRDPKDTMVSAYFQKTARSERDGHSAFKGTISEYIKNKIGGLETFLYFYKYWLDERKNFQNFYLLNYNTFRQNQIKEFEQLLSFLQVGIDNEKVVQALEFSSFKNMHKMEKNNEFKTGILQPTNEKDTNSFKTRKGKVGGYMEYLSNDDIEFIDNQTKKILGDI
jgi:hypothetical protein